MKSSIFLFLSFFLLSSLSLTTSDPDIVRTTCEKCLTNTPIELSVCTNLFDSIPESHNFTLVGLGVIAAKLANDNGTNILSKLWKLLEPPEPQDSYNKSCIEACRELYSDSVPGLGKSVGAIAAGQYVAANTWISAAVDASTDCEQAFSNGLIESPVKEENDGFFEISVIALGVVAMLQGQIILR